MDSFQSIACYTEIDGVQIAEQVLSLSVEASVRSRARCLRLTLNDPDGQIRDAAVKDAAISFSWIFDGGDPVKLFTGTIAKPDYPNANAVRILAYDGWSRIATELHTITWYQQSPADMLRALVGGVMGMDTSGVADYDGVLDKLPLFGMSAAEAVAAINRRMKLDHVAFIDGDGVFQWRPIDFTPEPAWSFAEGVDLFHLDMRTKRFETWGRDIRLLDVIELTDRDGVSYRTVVTDLAFSEPKDGSLVTATFEIAPEEAA